MEVWAATICFHTIEAKKLGKPNAARRGMGQAAHGLSWLRWKRMVSICESLINSALFNGLLMGLKLEIRLEPRVALLQLL